MKKTATIYLHRVEYDKLGTDYSITESRMDTIENWTIVDQKEITFDIPESRTAEPGMVFVIPEETEDEK